MQYTVSLLDQAQIPYFFLTSLSLSGRTRMLRFSLLPLYSFMKHLFHVESISLSFLTMKAVENLQWYEVGQYIPLPFPFSSPVPHSRSSYNPAIILSLTRHLHHHRFQAFTQRSLSTEVETFIMRYTALLLPLVFTSVALSAVTPQATKRQEKHVFHHRSLNASVATGEAELTSAELVATVFGLAQTVQDLAAAVHDLSGTRTKGAGNYTINNSTSSHNGTGEEMV